MDDLTNRNYNSVCRLCLCGDDRFVSIFDENYGCLSQRIAACVNVEVHETDKMTTLICKQCLTKVEEWYDFKRCCEDSQSKLRIWANIEKAGLGLVGVTIKEEVHSDEDDPLELFDASLTIKTEALESYLSETDDLDDTVLLRLSPDVKNISSVSNNDQLDLLVPSLECPVSAHGINAPLFKKGYYTNGVQNKNEEDRRNDLSTTCRLCGKKFSNVHNRFRHERNLHSREPRPYVAKDVPELEPEEPIVDSSNVTLQQFAASLQLVQTVQTSQTYQQTSSQTNQQISLETNQQTSLQTDLKIELQAELQTVQQTELETDRLKEISARQFIAHHRKLLAMTENVKCDCCNHKFANMKGLLCHLNKKMKIEPYSCFLCCISFPNRSQFMKHRVQRKLCKQRYNAIQTGRSQIKAYQHYKCVICNILYVHKFILTRHLINTHMPMYFPSNCIICKSEQSNSDDFRKHLFGPCFTKIYCSICKTDYNNIEDFEEHSKVHEEKIDDGFDPFLLSTRKIKSLPSPPSSPLELPETVINPAARKLRSKKTHIKRIQMKKKNANNPTKCQVCFKQYSSYHNLLRHVREKHKTCKVYRCKQCPRKFIFKGHFRQHILTEHENGERMLNNNYSCVECGALFATLDEWCDHQQTHSTGNLHQCNECSRVFGSQNELEQHKTTHSNIKLKLLRCAKSNSYSVSDSSNPEKVQKSVDLPYKCPFCSKSYPFSSSLLKHKKAKHGKNLLPRLTNMAMFGKKKMCVICYKVLPNSKQLWYHKKKFHGAKFKTRNSTMPVLYPEITESTGKGKSEHVCNICNKAFSTLKKLSIHASTHAQRDFTNSPEKLQSPSIKSEFPDDLQAEKPACVCPICNKSCVNNAGLSSHVKIHGVSLSSSLPPDVTVKQEPANFECEICQMTLTHRGSLTNHMKVHKNEGKVAKSSYKCTICLDYYSSNEALNNHYKVIHEEDTKPILVNEQNMERFGCNLCEKSFTREGLLRNHMKSHVKPEKSVPKKRRCGVCKKLFSTSQALGKHMKMHSLNRASKLSCEHCDKTFDTLNALNSHRGWHLRVKGGLPSNSKKLRCDVCNVVMEFKSHLIEHMKTHTSSGLKCEFCDKTFFYMGSLKKHILYNHNNGNSTKNENNLKSNIVSKPKVLKPVQSDRVYKCTQCQTTFNNAKNLRLHVISVHNINF